MHLLSCLYLFKSETFISGIPIQMCGTELCGIIIEDKLVYGLLFLSLPGLVQELC